MLNATTVWDQFGQLVTAADNADISAPIIAIKLDGVTQALGDELTFAYDVKRGRAQDFRQALVINTNGDFRLRHLDGAARPLRDGPCRDRAEDCFGTTLVLPPGLIRGPDPPAGDDFFLTVKLSDVNLITTKAPQGKLTLRMSGSPANAQGDLAPVTVTWRLTVVRPTNDRSEVQLTTTATFNQDFDLSSTALNQAEAFRAGIFRSSNNTTATAEFPAGTHDAEQLRLTDVAGNPLIELNLTDAPRGTLLLPPGVGTPTGLPFDGWMQLNQRTPSPLNFDPPNISMRVALATDDPEYRAQGFISDVGPDHNQDNVGAWISRTLPDPTISAGNQFQWSLEIVATDAAEDGRPERPAKALWVFNDEVVGNAKKRRDLVRAAARDGVEVLYVSIYQPTPNADGRLMFESKVLANLIRRAHREGIEVAAAYGAPDWAERACGVDWRDSFPIQRVQEVIAYNADVRFPDLDGIILDVEPQAATPVPLPADVCLLELYDRTRLIIDEHRSPVEFGVAINAFWHHSVLFGQTDKALYQHLIDMGVEGKVDHVVVLAYRDTATEIVSLAQEELTYAGQVGAEQSMIVGVETRCGEADNISFCEERREALDQALDELRGELGASFERVAIHQYLDMYLNPTWEN